jgi:hypothetical protein
VFAREIAELVAKGVTYIDACWGIEDVTMLVPMIRGNLNLMSKLTMDAENLNFIKRVPRLPI